MTRRWYVALAALVVTVSLVGALVLVVRAQSADTAGRPQISAPPTATPPTGTPPVQGPTTGPTPTGPPAGTAQLADNYRARYAGRYVGWDALIEAGKPLPAASAGCRADWRAARRDQALDWGKAGYLCLDRLTGTGFKPQGVAGSGSTLDYRIAGRPADRRNLVIVTSYSTKPEPGLRFPHEPGRSEATRLTVIDLDRARYNTVELVRPTGTDELRALDSHGSGLVWVGQYLYSSSKTALFMYNADQLMEIDGRFVLPAVSRWAVSGRGGLSSIGLDRTTKPASLISINYTETGTAWAQSLALDRTGRLRQGRTRAAERLELTSTFGPGPATVRSVRSSVVPGTNFQGIGTVGRYRLVNSSSLMLDGRRYGDNVMIMRKNRMLARFAMPAENVESLFVDHRRDRYVTVTEHGRQFLFWLPVDHLITRAKR